MMRVHSWQWVAAGAISSAVLTAASAAVAADAARTEKAAAAAKGESAETMVADALRAELDGNLAKRRVLLSVAVDLQPDFAPARWHSGQVRAGGKWQNVKAAQAAAAADPARAQYKALRDAAEGKPEAQLALARWCRKNGLEDEARFHWSTLLTFAPNNQEALRALGVRWFNGRLMTKAEVATAKAAFEASQEAAKAYSQQVGRWERALAAGDLKSRNEALAEIRELRDLQAIAALEQITLDRELKTNDQFEKCQQLSEAWLAALREMPEQAATLSLLRHAVISPLQSARDAALAELKTRSPHDYVPTLLGSLAMPLESSYRVVTDTDGSVHYFHSLYREGPMSDWSYEGRLSAMQHDLRGPTDITVDDRVRGEVTRIRLQALDNPLVKAEMASVAVANQKQFGTKALAAEKHVAIANKRTEAANAILIPVLTATTGQDLGSDPRKWWDWWQRYNEYSSDDEKPVNEQRYADASHRYYRLPQSYTQRIDPPPPPPPPPPPGYRRSCFAKGTQVWTKTGLAPIETLEIGELVLAQSVDTGELAYKPVIGRTVRPPSAILGLRFGKEEIETTLGHPLWVVGTGWQMAKELTEGGLLHGVNGPVRVDAIDNRDKAEAYNLVVADFNTFFVGVSGVLVHDNTLRQSTTAVVPGLLAAEVSR